MPDIRISGNNALIVALYIFAIFGSLHLLALARPEWTFSKILLTLGF
jgi:hypothetical protein